MLTKASTRLFLFAAAALLAYAEPGCQAAWAGETLDAVRAAGSLKCGLVSDVDDYSEADTHGNLTALGADFCRAMAAEIFGDPSKTITVTVSDEPSGLAALRDKKADVLFGATPDPVIGAAYGLLYGPPIFFDGQGFLVPKAEHIATVADLAGRRICFINASRPEQALYDLLEPKLHQPVQRFPFSERGEMEAALVAGRCDAITGDISWMANARLGFHAATDRFDVMPQTITIDPFSPAYRSGDPQWGSLIDWTVWVLLQAEEYGVTRANAGSLQNSSDVVVQRIVGVTPWIAKSLGISDDGFRHAIQAVGNYGELYDRDVGPGSPLGLPRGHNQPAAKGGLMWALPIEPLE